MPPYPLRPKSSAKLTPGDFWPIPLVNGQFGCGRVLQRPPAGLIGGRTQFLGGLMDWHGDAPPTAADLRGASTIDQGIMHLRSIIDVGGAILGNRPLEHDGEQPWAFVNGDRIQRGYDDLRAWSDPTDNNLPPLGWQGWNIIWLRANERLIGVDLPDDAEPPRPRTP